MLLIKKEESLILKLADPLLSRAMLITWKSQLDKASWLALSNRANPAARRVGSLHVIVFLFLGRFYIQSKSAHFEHISSFFLSFIHSFHKRTDKQPKFFYSSFSFVFITLLRLFIDEKEKFK